MHRKPNVEAPAFPAPSPASAAEQAARVADLFPVLIRQLFTLEDDPLLELPLAQLRVCLLLYDQPRAMSALSRELMVSLSAMTQMADRLERAGLVERVAEDTDRRVRLLRLTSRGQQAVAARSAARLRSVSAAFAHLSPAARKKIVHALELLYQACLASAEMPAPRP